MNHDELLEKLEQRFDKLDEKLDEHVERVAKLETDVSWLSGSLKTSLGFILSLTVGLITTFLRTIKGE